MSGAINNIKRKNLMTPKVSKGTKFRIMVYDNGLFSVERRYLGFIFWPVFKTYNSKGALTYLDLCCAEYNKATDLFEVNK